MKNLTADASPKGNYVLLASDSLRIILPQHEVGPAQYLDGPLEESSEPGLLRRSGSDATQRFIALSAQMKPRKHCPSDHFLLVTLGDDSSEFRWCWKELRVLINTQLDLLPIPSSLLTPISPITHYVELNGKPAYFCNARRLQAFALEQE